MARVDERLLEEWNRACPKASLKKEDLLVLTPYTLAPSETKPCRGILAATRTELLLPEDGELTFRIPLQEVDSFFAETGTGCVLFGYRDKADGAPHLLGRTDSSTARRLQNAIGRLNRYLTEGETGLSYRERTGGKCPKCGKPYPRGGHTCPRCVSKTKSLGRLLRMARPEWKLLVLASLFFVLTTLVGLLLPYLNRFLVDDYVQSHPNKDGFWIGFAGVVLSIFLFNGVRHLLSLGRGRTLVIAGNRLIVRLRARVFQKIEALAFGDVSKRSTGELMKLVGADTTRIRQFLIHQLPGLVEQMLLLLAVSVVLFAYDWRLALLILLPALPVTLAFRLVWTWMRKLFARRRELNARADSVLHDVFSGIRVVKAYGMEEREERRFVSMAKGERDAQIRQEKAWALLMPFLNFCMSIGEFIILYYVGRQMLDGRMTAGEMAQFSSYASMVYAPLAALMRLPRQFLRMMTSLTKVCELLDTPTKPLGSTEAPHRIEGRIDLEKVSFAYEDKDVLHGIDLHVKAGEFIGLVGRSGVGKSTLINLLMHLYDVNAGSIRIDGVDLREISEENLRAQMGVVLQETFLFSGTVWQNLTYAKPDATREEVLHAAKAARAHEFILRLPDGYNTYVGERGYTLSGGERQRIAIARALLHDPRILILDEATSALDTETERQVQEALRALCQGRTTIAIAHRLSTLRNATRLVVLSDGRVAEEGTHDELMEKGGIYYGLVMAQREMSQMPHGET